MADEGFKRKLAAILSADVIGYSRLMRDDEEATVRDIATHRVLISDIIQQHHGRVVDSPGDNILAEFGSVVDAVNGAIKIQEEIKKINADTPEDRRMEFRIGINLGDVIEEEERIYGDGVNIAARVEGLAAGGGIAISGIVYDSIKDKLSLGYYYLGEQDVKNIPEPVRIYRLLTEPEDAGKLLGIERKASKKGWYWVATAAVVVAVVGLGIWQFYLRRPAIEPASVEKMAYPLPDKPSIAVLPFANLSGEPEQEFLGDGIADSIITALSQDPGLFIIARNSTFSYKGKPVKIQKVAEELGIRYVLAGSVQKSGNRIRIAVQLVDAISGHHLWADHYDSDLEDLFALQDEIIIKILTALRVKLTSFGEQARQAARGTNNPKIFLKYLKAREYLLRWNRDDNDMARQMLEEIITLDPNYSIAYSSLAWTYLNDLYFNPTKSPKKSIGQALELVEKALTIDNTLSVAIETRGYVYMQKGQHEKALAEYERAITLNPNLPDLRARSGIALTYVGRLQDAIASFEKAIRLNPIPPGWYLRNLARCYRMVGRYEDSILAYKGALDRSPDDLFAQVGLTATYSTAGRLNEAHAQAAEVLRVQPKFSVKNYTKRFPFKDKAESDKLTTALLNAGLPENPPLPLPDKPSIAVLAFDNLSGDSEQEYFSDGIAENIITALSKVGELFVIARNSSFTYKGKPVKVQQIGRELGVRYVLEGGVQKSGDRVRITAQLIDATTGYHLWSEKYDRDIKDLFSLQDEITLEIIRAMRVQLTEGEQASVTGKGTKNLDAYLKANQAQEQFYRMNKEGSMKAKELAREAIGLDPNYAFPYATLANAHMLDVWFKFSASSEESLRMAAQAAQKAMALDDSDPRAYHALTNLYIMQRQYEKAISAAERTLELSPSSARAHSSMGMALRFSGKFSEAIPFLERAIRLDPYPPAVTFRLLGSCYRSVSRYEEAITAYKKALQKNFDDIFTHINLAVTYVKLGREEEARAEAKEVTRIHPKFSLANYAKSVHSKHQASVDDYMECLRRAGLPE